MERGMSEKLDAMFGADAAEYIRQLQAEIAEAAAFLDAHARFLDTLDAGYYHKKAADCRAMAKKLRGEPPP
jgi:hypothetical protein